MKKQLIAILLLLIPVLAKADGEQYQEISGFSGGLNSFYDGITIDDTEVQDALNVDFNIDGTTSKRTGFTTYASTTPVKYLNEWTYTDSSNTSWIITLASDCIRASNGNGSFSVVVATVPAPAISKVSAVPALGVIVFVDAAQGVYYWNGSSTTYVSGSPKGTLIAEYKGRAWVAGESAPNQNRLSSSQYLNISNWTTGNLVTDPVIYTVGLNDRSDGITALYSGGNDALYIPKNRSMNALLGFDQSDFELRILSTEAGCIDNGSIKSYSNGIVCVSERGVELFDGANFTRLSRKIDDKLSKVIVSNFNQQSWTQDTSVDFKTGTLTGLSTYYVDGKLYLSSFTGTQFVDTSTPDFNAGSFGTDVNVVNSSQAVTLAVQSSSITVEKQITPIGILSSDNWRAGFLATKNYTLLQGDLYYNADVAATIPTVETVKLCADPGCSTVLSTAPYTISATGSHWASALLTTPVALTQGTSYYWQLEITSHIHLLTTKSSGSGGDFDGIFINYGRIYNSSGTFTSRTFDLGYTTTTRLTDFGNLASNYATNGQSLILKIQTSPDASTWTSFVVSTGAPPAITVQRYLRYQALFSSTDSVVTPILYDFSIPVNGSKSTSGVFKTSSHPLSNITSWSIFSVSEDESTGGSVSYSVCTSSSADMITDVCVTQTENSAIVIATNNYVQVFSTFTITSATQNPNLDFFTVKWNSGDPRPSMQSVVYKDKYLLATSTAGASDVNDSVLVLSKTKDNGLIWSIYDYDVGGFTLYKGQLYHADANATGRVYLDDQGYSDNGQAINAYVKTKDYTAGSIISDKLFVKFWLVARALGNYNLTNKYYVDRDPTEFALDSVNEQETNNLLVQKLPFPIDSTHQVFGRTISFKIGNNENNAPFTLFGGVLSYKTRKPL